jgi:hypothetical protein
MITVHKEGLYDATSGFTFVSLLKGLLPAQKSTALRFAFSHPTNIIACRKMLWSFIY